MIKIQQYDYPWNAESFIKHLQVFGFTLIAVSMLYLVAANWFMLPQNIQLAIPQLLLLFSAVCSLWLTKHDFLVQCLHSICGLMIGLSLAVIGQIYQTVLTAIYYFYFGLCCFYRGYIIRISVYFSFYVLPANWHCFYFLSKPFGEINIQIFS